MTAEHTPGICLNMILKDEAKTVERAIRSALPFVSSWCVVDTGSTDGTQSIVTKLLSHLPGTLHERPWRSFAENRNESLALARELVPTPDYLLLVDGDDYLEPNQLDLVWQQLRAIGRHDVYNLEVRRESIRWRRPHLFRASPDLEFKGVVHELLVSKKPSSPGSSPGVGFIEGLIYRNPESSSPRFERDIVLLRQALAADPSDSRSAFYLAQSLRDAGKHEEALEAYRARVALDPLAATPNAFPAEETWCALLQVALLEERLERPQPEVIDAYLRAHEARPSRAESSFHLARFLRTKERIRAAYPFAYLAAGMPKPQDRLFLDDSVYGWRAFDELGVSAYWTGRYREGEQACTRALMCPDLPKQDRGRIQENLRLCAAKR